MEDIGITPEQFQDACAEGKKYHVSFDNVILVFFNNLILILMFLEYLRANLGGKRFSNVRENHDPTQRRTAAASVGTDREEIRNHSAIVHPQTERWTRRTCREKRS